MPGHRRAGIFAAPSLRVSVQVLGPLAAAVLVVLAFGNMKAESTASPPTEPGQVRGIAASEVQGELALPVPTAPAPVEEKAAPARKTAARKPQPAPPAAAEPPTLASAQPGAMAPTAAPAERESFVTSTGKASLAALRSSADFVTTTVPRAVVSTTREAVGTVRAVLERVTP